jgi:periplasmic protein TonB
MAIPANTDFSANERFKAGFDSWFWVSMMAAVLIHFATFAFWPDLTATSMDDGPTSDFTGIELPPEIDIPPAPERLARPALPIIADVDLAEDVTIASTDWKDNPVSELAPPPPEVRQEVARASNITPFTLAPAVLNTDEVVRAMRREYPSVLRNAGVGGNVRVIFSIDENGRVLDTELAESSGYELLDAAALAVADVIEFSPAMNRDQRVAVRVVFPIVFRVDDLRQ